MKLFVLLQSLLIVAVLAGEKVRYDNYQVFKVTPLTTKHVEILKQFEENPNGYSFWNSVIGVNKSVEIMVPPHLALNFKDSVDMLGLKSELYIENVQKLIDKESEANEKVTKVQNMRRTKSRDLTWDRYYKLSEINLWLNSLAQRYPNVVKLVKGGTTYEKRDILGVHVSYSANNTDNAVFIEGGIHAREWIAPATATYILNQLLTSEDTTIRSIAESHDWYIFPVINADGYEYTHTSDRLWRKTRVPYDFCYGADPNRNWGSHWNEVGASNFPCSETYAGPKPFSEPTTKSFSEYISTIGSKLKAYIAFHAYSQLLMVPYGHTADHLENYDELYSVGIKAVDSLAKRYGTKYQVGNIYEIVYPSSGDSMDWVKDKFHTRVTYTYELRDTGTHGFVLPPDQILPNSLEVLDSLVTIFTEFK